MSMHRWTALAAVWSGGAGVLGSDLSNNLARPTGGAETAMAGQWLAANFACGASAHTLSAVVLRVANPFPGEAEVRVYSDGGLEPGALLATLIPPPSYTAGASDTVFTCPGLALTAGATYWVVLRPVSGQFDWSWAQDTSGAGAGFVGAWGVSEEAGSSWWTHHAYPLQMNVVVDTCPCPADFGCDGFVDFFDYDAFVSCFEAGSCPAGRTADVNLDGFVDFFDYDAFVASFESGC